MSEHGSTAPPNYLAWALLSTLLCCPPFGIASIVFSSQVNSKWEAEDVSGAQAASAKARKFAIWATAAGVVFWVLYVLSFFALHALGAGATTGS
jgi:hypothetical protein